MTAEDDEVRQPSQVAENIRRIRTESGRTVTSLASRVSDLLGRNLSQSTLSQAELGKRGLQVDELQAIGRVLRTPVSEFFVRPEMRPGVDAVLVRRTGDDRYLPELDRIVRTGEVVAMPPSIVLGGSGRAPLLDQDGWERDSWTPVPLSPAQEQVRQVKKLMRPFDVLRDERVIDRGMTEEEAILDIGLIGVGGVGEDLVGMATPAVMPIVTPPAVGEVRAVDGHVMTDGELEARIAKEVARQLELLRKAEAANAEFQAAVVAEMRETGDSVEWPEGRGVTPVAPEVVEGWAAQVNELRAHVEHLEAKVGERGKRLTALGPRLDALAAEVERVRDLADRVIDYAAGLGLQEDDTIRSPLPETIDEFRREAALS